MYVEKIQTWEDNWHDIIRYVVFQDEELKRLMLLPEDLTITQFVDKYFIEDDAGGELLTNEKVRITYCDAEGMNTKNKAIKYVYKEFDIYVKDGYTHVSEEEDMLKNRYNLIDRRLRYLLTHEYHIYNMHFDFVDSYNLWTKTAGYKRYHVIFSYKKSV